MNAIIPPLATRGPCVTIRKFPATRFTMDDLVDMGTISRPAAMFLRAAVIDQRNILVSGGTGTTRGGLAIAVRARLNFGEGPARLPP